MVFRLVYEVGYKSAIGSEFDHEHILENGQPFDVLVLNAQEAAEWIANLTESFNENEKYGYYHINVLNWIREEVWLR